MCVIIIFHHEESNTPLNGKQMLSFRLGKIAVVVLKNCSQRSCSILVILVHVRFILWSSYIEISSERVLGPMPFSDFSRSSIMRCCKSWILYNSRVNLLTCSASSITMPAALSVVISWLKLSHALSRVWPCGGDQE